jgi:hypothetical protein
MFWATKRLETDGWAKRNLITLGTNRPKFSVLISILVLTGCGAKDPNLNSWSHIGDAEWTSTTDITKSTNQFGSGFLVSTELYANFELTVEFRPDAAVNSGVLVRCQDPEDIALSNCYEINIWDRHPNQDYRTGAIVTHSIPPFVHLDSVGKWNRYRIIANGDKLRVWLNDKLTAKMSKAKLSSGYIALQSAGGKIEFRNLSIKTNPK